MKILVRRSERAPLAPGPRRDLGTARRRHL